MKNDPIPELKDNGSYSNKRIVSVLNTLIRRENERNEGHDVCGCGDLSKKGVHHNPLGCVSAPQTQPEDSTKAEHDSIHCHTNCTGYDYAGEYPNHLRNCPCKCHKAVEHDEVDCFELGCAYPLGKCPCSCHKKPECKHEWKSETGNCAHCGKFPSKQDTVQEAFYLLQQEISTEPIGSMKWRGLNEAIAILRSLTD